MTVVAEGRNPVTPLAPASRRGFFFGLVAVPRSQHFRDPYCLVVWLGLPKAPDFLVGYVFIKLPAYHRSKGAIRMT